MRWLVRTIRQHGMLLLILGAAILLLGGVLGPSGIVRGVEFSPDLFAHRSFGYYQWCGIQVMPRDTEVWRADIDEYLHSAGFVPEFTGAKPRWDFVKGFAPGIRGWSGHAKPMCKVMGCWGGDDKWVVWSQQHPALAAVLWPQVVGWAREQHYDRVWVLLSMDFEKVATAEDLRERIAFVNANQDASDPWTDQ